MVGGPVARNPGLVIREHNTLQDSNPQPEESFGLCGAGLSTSADPAFHPFSNNAGLFKQREMSRIFDHHQL